MTFTQCLILALGATAIACVISGAFAYLIVRMVLSAVVGSVEGKLDQYLGYRLADGE